MTPELERMVSARDFIDFPTGFAIQAAYELAHDPRCSFIVGDGAFLCDCHAVPLRWCELRDELGLSVDEALRSESIPPPSPEREEKETHRG